MGRRQGSDERKTAEQVISACADIHWHKGAFANAIVYEHPTLQQYFMETILETVSAMADEYLAGRYDGRNEETMRAAFVMRAALIDDAERNGKQFTSTLPHV